MLLDLSELKNRVNTWKKDNNNIVFTNGCFDLLHQGHIDLLKYASSIGDRLIIGINSDESVSNLKGLDRPIESEMIRINNILELGLISAITVFNEETPIDIITAIKPNFLVKGGDYSPEDIAGYNELLSWGGMVKIFPLKQGFSTTEKIIKMKREGLV
ncbi:MAG: D-glycero-beta-D-manno-heptose 1-phosphate adenylyltransferase [Candidatus Marinimicrobia bacterium]|nr:D-glycero-beta-D-manno-heptose 1-phosphate adenylyltransferase [Candidatus Neomarinimicrobiota bacterium]